MNIQIFGTKKDFETKKAERYFKERGIRSAVVGKVEAGIARKIIGPGGTGYLERPQPDETYKLRQQEA